MAEEIERVRVLSDVRLHGEHQGSGTELETSVDEATLLVGLGKAEYVDAKPRVVAVHQDPASPAAPASPLAVAVVTDPRMTTSPTDRTGKQDLHARAPGAGEQPNYPTDTTEQPAVKIEGEEK